MSVVGCYSLDLYCDGDNPAHRHGEFPAEFAGKSKSVCLRDARRRGWKIVGGEQYAFCPKCKRPRTLPESPRYDTNGGIYSAG